jgi:small subunit ribosomal protein S21
LGVLWLAEIRLQEGEGLEQGPSALKRKVRQEDIIKEVKRHSYYLKPGEKKHKEALARKRSRKKARKEQD